MMAVTAISSFVIIGCSKKDSTPAADSDEAAAQSLVGTYKGTIHVVSGSDYFNAEINITKENGATVKTAPQSGQPYSTFTTRTTGSKADYYVADVTAKNESGKIKITISFVKVGTGLLKLQKIADAIKEELGK